MNGFSLNSQGCHKVLVNPLIRGRTLPQKRGYRSTITQAIVRDSFPQPSRPTQKRDGQANFDVENERSFNRQHSSGQATTSASETSSGSAECQILSVNGQESQ